MAGAAAVRAACSLLVAAGMLAGASPAVSPQPAAAATADFNLTLSGAPSFNPGTSASVTATVTPLNGETSPITLVPDQTLVEASPPVAVTLAPYGSTTFTLSANAILGAGTYTFGVDGYDDSGTSHRATTTYTLTATPATFSLNASPSTLALQPGQSGTVTVSISTANGMTADVLLGATLGSDSAGTGTRPVPTFSDLLPATRVPPPYTAQPLTFTVPPNTEIGTYHYLVAGASDDSSPVDATTDVYVVVTNSPDFTVAAGAGPTINPGTSGTVSVSITPVNGESSPITITPDPGVAQLSPPSQVLQPPYGTATFTVSANASVPPGTYSQGFTAADDHGFWHRTTTTFSLTASPAQFTLSASPAALTIPTGGSATSQIGLSAANGMSAPVVLAAAPGTDTAAAVEPVATWGNGAGALAVSTAPYGAQSLLLTVAPSTPLGTYHFVVRGASDNANPATASADVYVNVVAGQPLPSPRAQGVATFHGNAHLSTFPCSPPPPFGSGPCTGSFSGDWAGHLAGFSGTSPYDVTWLTQSTSVNASFRYYELQCLGGSETVAGTATGTGTASAAPSEVQGKWQVVGEAFPRDVVGVHLSFSFTWTRVANSAVLQLAPISVVLDVNGLGSETVATQPQSGVATLIVTGAGGVGVPTCATPLSNVQGVIAGTVPVVDTGT